MYSTFQFIFQIKLLSKRKGMASHHIAPSFARHVSRQMNNESLASSHITFSLSYELLLLLLCIFSNWHIWHLSHARSCVWGMRKEGVEKKKRKSLIFIKKIPSRPGIFYFFCVCATAFFDAFLSLFFLLLSFQTILNIYQIIYLKSKSQIRLWLWLCDVVQRNEEKKTIFCRSKKTIAA